MILIIIVLSSCNQSNKTNDYSVDSSDALISKAKESQLSQNDYFEILSQLDGMFEIVYTKAEQAKEKGIFIDSIRNYLACDSEYVIISQQAIILDSVLVKYIKSPTAPQDLRNKYVQINLQAAKRAQQVGLN